MNATSMTHTLRRRAAALAVAGIAFGAAAAPAMADSVAYVKDGDVWLAATDGSRQYQVTADGGYSTVSQADSGRLVALRGDHIRHLERDGRVIADIVTPVSTTSDPSMSFRGPYDPAISPDGTRVAYTYYWQYTGYDPYCNPSTNCYVKRLYHGTAFTSPNRLTAWDEPGFLRRSGWIDASWVDNTDVLLSDPYIQPNEDTVLWNPSDAGSLRRWFQDPGYRGDVKDAVISRDRSAMATITAGGQGMSILRSVGGFFPAYPNRCYEASVADQGPDARISSPTLSADGRRLLWAEPDGIHAATLPKFTADSCGTLTDGGALVLPGASSPAWGPADVPAPRPAAPGGGAAGGGTPNSGGGGAPNAGTGGTGGTAGGGGGTTLAPAPGGGTVAAAPRLSVSSANLRTVLRTGLDVRIRGAKPGRHTVTARIGGRKAGSASVRIAADGRGRARVRFTKTARRAYAKRARVSVTITAAGASRRVSLLRR